MDAWRAAFGVSPPGAPLTDRGQLLIEEPAEDTRKRSKAISRVGRVSIVTGIVVSVLGPVIAILGGLGTLLRTYLFMSPSFGILFVALGGYLWGVSRRIQPLRFYENGLDIPSLDGRSVFWSYGELTRIDEIARPIAGPMYVFDTHRYGPAVAVRKDMAGLQDLVEIIRRKLRRDEFVVRLEPTETDIRADRRTERALFTLTTVVVLAFGAVTSMAVNAGDPLGVFLAGFGLYTPSMVMIAVVLVAYGMRGGLKSLRGRLNVKTPAAVIIGMLVFFSVSHVVFSNAFGPSPNVLHIGPRPASTAIAPRSYENRTITAEGDVRVDSGEALHLSNSTLVLNLTADKQFGIWVAQGGTLTVDRSSIHPADARFLYTFEIMGSARIVNSTISGLWGEWDDYDGGLEIYSDDVVIEESTIEGARQTGILVVRASPRIANSTIRGAGDDGIELQGSNARIVNNLITLCEWGLYVYGGSVPVIESNVISYNAFGVLVVGSSPVIRNNTFEHNEHAAVTYRDPSTPVLIGNRYISNEANVVREANYGVLDVWLVLTAGSAVTGLVLLSRVNRGSRGRPGATPIRPRKP